MAFTEDISAFLSTDEFAVTASIDGRLVNVIFDNGYQDALSGLMESTQISCTGRTADLAASVQDTYLTIDYMTYRVNGNQPDGTGVTKLLLEFIA